MRKLVVKNSITAKLTTSLGFHESPRTFLMHTFCLDLDCYIYESHFVSQIYCRPTYQYFEFQLMNPKQHRWSLYNSLARLLVTSIYTALVTLIAAAMPFFGDFVALCGAIGFTPLDFIFPILAFLRVKRPKSRIFWAFNIGIVVLYTLVAILGAIGSIRYIVKDTVRYHFFQNQ